VLEVSAAVQSDWLDENLPKLLSFMAASPELRTRIAGSLAATKAPPASLMPLAAGLAPGRSGAPFRPRPRGRCRQSPLQ
jgi:hypothetical protein